MRPTYALSVKQPWAWLICKGYKDIENRSWETIFRGRVYIHASKSPEPYNERLIDYLVKRGLSVAATLALCSSKLAKGAIVGEVDVIDCVKNSESIWAEKGMCHYVLANPVLYGRPIPCKGKLKFFRPELLNREAAQ